MVDEERLAEEMSRVRPVTRDLIESVILDKWPNHAAVVDFGIDSQTHYEALYYAIREGEIWPLELDRALGHGEKLTRLLRAAPSNPHADDEFHTSWDVMLGREPSRKAAQAEPTGVHAPDVEIEL
ncbi:MAG TPA: hypothetical protein VG826_05540 [Pirellulales bacterium]|nr:hypothetical protein [Pirellulales bacterium]